MAPRSRFCSAFAIFSQELRASAIEQLLDFPSILDGLFQAQNHGLGHVHGGAASLIAEGQEPSWMFVATGTGRAVFADAGFINFGQGAFEGGPEGGDLMLPLLVCWRMVFHSMYVCIP